MPTRDHYEHVYSTGASSYEDLVSHEDAHGRLLPAIERLIALDGALVVEAGAGTGRLTRLLAPKVSRLRAFDAAADMLAVARTHLGDRPNVELAVADHACLPVESGLADLALEGWAFGHAVGWHPDDWRGHVQGYVDELSRVVRPGGTLLLLETLGTGTSEPRPPSAGLEELYATWESQGFRREVLRTDYRFDSVDEARALTKAFFRKDFDWDVRPDGVWLAECTGMWWKRKG